MNTPELEDFLNSKGFTPLSFGGFRNYPSCTIYSESDGSMRHCYVWLALLENHSEWERVAVRYWEPMKHIELRYQRNNIPASYGTTVAYIPTLELLKRELDGVVILPVKNVPYSTFTTIATKP